MSHLGELSKVIKKAADEGLPNSTAIFRAAWPVIRATKRLGFSHVQIHKELTEAGVILSFGYYRNLFSENGSSSKEKPAPLAKSARASDDPKEDQQRDGGNLTTHQQLAKIRAKSKIDYRKLK